jgi:diguanylate cyclase (GGDEF)-like protein
MLSELHSVVSRLSKGQLITSALVITALLGVADGYTGSEISLSILYVAPVALATWYAGKRSGLLIAIFAIAVWLLADFKMGLFARPIVPIWNAGMRFGLLFIIVMLLTALRQQLHLRDVLARTDALTGIPNRRAFMEQLEYSRALAARTEKPFTLAFVDLDDFKRINDTYGHNAGDQVLRAIASTLRGALRGTDIVARLGGDEFALLLPETNSSGAKKLLCKVSRALGSVKGVPMPTCSMGAVTFLSPPANAEGALKSADLLMYEVKKKGKSGITHLEVDPRCN